MKITPALLRRKGACDKQVARFRELFPGGITPTLAACEAVAGVFDWGWAAAHLLTDTAWADYRRVTAPAWADYDWVAGTLVDYRRIKAAAWFAGWEKDHPPCFVALEERG